MMAGRNVATASLGLTIKTNADQELEGLKNAWKRHLDQMKNAAEAPFEEMNRQALAAAKLLEKLFNKQLGSPVGQKFFDDLNKIIQLADTALGKLGSLSSNQIQSPGAMPAIRNMQSVKEAAQYGLSQAIPNADIVRAREQANQQQQLEFIRGRTFQRPEVFGMPAGFEPFRGFAGPHIPQSMRNFRQLAADPLDMPRSIMGTNLPMAARPWSREDSQDVALESRRQTSSKRLAEYREERQAVLHLAEAYSKLSAAERHELQTQANAMRDSGQQRYRLMGAALNEVEQQKRMGIGPGSFSHAFRYGTQNAAFALEDYMISSQYGGPKAGFRAITNNLTAIAAAATGSLNPLTAGAVIAGVAVAGASAPLMYDAMTGSSDQDAEIYKKYATPGKGVMSRFQSGALSQDLISKGPQSALASYLQAEAKEREVNLRRSEVLRTMSSRTTQLAGVQTTGGEWVKAWLEQYMGTAEDVSGSAGVITNFLGNMFSGERLHPTWNRSWKELSEIDQARKQKAEINKSLEGMDDPNVAADLRQKRLQDLQRENKFFSRDADLRNARRSIQARQGTGEIVSPEEDFGLERRLFLREQMRLQRNWQGTPEGLQAQLDSNQASFADRQAQLTQVLMPDFHHQLQQQQLGVRGQIAGMNPVLAERLAEQGRIFQEQVMARGGVSDEDKARLIAGNEATNARQLLEQKWAVRGRLAGFETDPRKALIDNARIGMEQIQADPNLDPGQRAGMLRGFMKSVARDLANINQTPDAGSAIEAGSSQDIRLRQPFFGPREGIKESLESLMREMVDRIERVEKAVKDNKPQAANVGRK